MPTAKHIPPCHPYRCWASDQCSPCDLRCADYLKRTIHQVGAENVAAFIAEPVFGVTLGAVPATFGYCARIREICDRHDVVFIADKVMTGFGRTGRPFALDHWEVVPDLIACAKGISGGSAPLGAVLARPELVTEVRRHRSSFVIGHTSSGNPLSCAAAVAVPRYMLAHDLIGNAARAGAYFLDQLQGLADRCPAIGDVRGLGLLAGVELVRDRTTKEPFPRDWKVSERVGEATLARGLVSYPMTGPVDGARGDHLLYAPPLIITRQQVDELISMMEGALGDVQTELAARR